MPYLYVFLDESGNDDFSPRGTDNWVLTSVLTEDINPGVAELYTLKHQLIALGTDVEYFHASEDRQSVRDRVFAIVKNLSNVRADSLVVDKHMASPKIQPKERFYPEMVSQLLKYPFDPRGINVQKYDKVIVFLDRAAAHRKERRALIGGVKKYLSQHLGGVPFTISMHASMSHHYLQIADYMCWAIARKWEKGDKRSYDLIKHLVKSEFPIFAHGAIRYY